jgi:hypothetical protein
MAGNLEQPPILTLKMQGQGGTLPNEGIARRTRRFIGRLAVAMPPAGRIATNLPARKGRPRWDPLMLPVWGVQGVPMRIPPST